MDLLVIGGGVFLGASIVDKLGRAREAELIARWRERTVAETRGAATIESAR